MAHACNGGWVVNQKTSSHVVPDGVKSFDGVCRFVNYKKGVAVDCKSPHAFQQNPRLIDEWQDAPKTWGAVHKSVDDRQENGLYIRTGSTSQIVETPHTGTMRISRMEMRVP